MLQTEIPRWIAKLDERKPYIEVLDGKKLPDVVTDHTHGELVARISIQLNEWAGDHGAAGVYVRFYFLHANGKWSSLLPDVDYTSYARIPNSMADTSQRPRVAPDIAVDILAPGDRPEWTKRKIEVYLEFGATVVLVLRPMKRTVQLHRADGSVEERDARGAWTLAPFNDLLLDWEDIYRGTGIGD
jgi:Uma2 family endonuclease